MRQPSFCLAKRTLALLTAVCLMLLTAACGGGGGGTTTQPVAIVISPTTATVATGTTQQFTATVSNASNTTVAWLVNGVTGGNASVGTITTGGLYTAPLIPLVPNTVTVTAVALADTTKTAAATVTIPLNPGVAIAPAVASVAAGRTLKFTAAIDGVATNAVNWLVNDLPGGNATVGTIDTFGGYTAPALVPNPATVTVTAVSQADRTQKASATVTITAFSTASLKGTFTFAMTGTNNNGDFHHAGAFTADGRGYIAGSSDYLQGNTVLLGKKLMGVYTVDPRTGVGRATLATPAGPLGLTFSMSGADYAKFIESDGKGTATGSMQRQDAASAPNDVQ